MSWLIGGVLLWSFVHVAKCLMPAAYTGVRNRLGEKAFKAIFSLLIVASVVLMVLGWRSSGYEPVYDPPQWGRSATVILTAIALILFFSARVATNLKRLLRHPQLTGFSLWAFAHLLSNGDARSLLLFGGLGLWGIAEIILISRRDGPWIRPPAVSMTADLVPVAIGLVASGVLIWLHPYFAGVAVMLQ